VARYTVVLDACVLVPIALADTPVFDQLWAGYPHSELSASGVSVGLPDGQMGNSEVGHLTLGAGAAVPQTLTLINDAVATGTLEANEVVRTALTASKRVHLVGMVSDGGVHSGFEHLHDMGRSCHTAVCTCAAARAPRRTATGSRR